MKSKLKCLETEAAKVGLKADIGKSKVVRCNTVNSNKLRIRNTELEEGTSFCYLGSILTNTGGSSKDVANSISKANQAFGILAQYGNLQ